MNIRDDDLPLHAWERKAIAGLLTLLIGAFLAWAGVVYNGTQTLITRLDDIEKRLSQNRLEDARMRADIIAEYERRVTIVEQRAEWLMQREPCGADDEPRVRRHP